jgi:GH15 family glucan-1,4-alpha-glucosidase
VRAGNAASEQFQLDVYGELMDALHQARVAEEPPQEAVWDVQRALMDFLEGHWRDPDDGIWEVRGQRRDFTHSKVMAWVAADRAVAAVERFGLPGPADRWKRLRQEIHDEVCQRGYDAGRGTFTQYYGSSTVDAALLLIAHVGFLPPDDPRLRGTVAAIEADLLRDGLVRRYRATDVDGLPAGEAAFLPCSFWLADNYLLQGRIPDGRRMLDRLLGMRNDLGLLSEEYDPARRRQLGNFPQALSHLALVNTVLTLADSRGGPIHRRRATSS